MKTLRYLLIVMSLVSVLGVYAQGLAKRPEATMQSTSVMVYSGSNLPQAAASGAVLTGNTVGTYTSTASYRPGHIRRTDSNGDGWEDEDDPENPGEPNPIGDAMWPLLALAAAYALLRVYRRKRRV